MDKTIYQAPPGNRCVIDTSLFSPEFTGSQVLKALIYKGFKPTPVDMVREGRFCVASKFAFKRQAKMSEAPDFVDCSGLTKWLYARRGIVIPRRPIQQYDFAKHEVEYPNVQAGDLLFFSGMRDLYLSDPKISIGHVVFATSDKTVIHASGDEQPVCEESMDEFMACRKLVGVRRIIPDPKAILTLEKSPKHDIESSDDVFWIVLRTLREGKF
jgi:hypothetical protein